MYMVMIPAVTQARVVQEEHHAITTRVLLAGTSKPKDRAEQTGNNRLFNLASET